MDVAHWSVHLDHGFLPGRHALRRGRQLQNLVALPIDDHGVAGHALGGRSVVGHLGIDVQVGRSLERIDGGGVDVGPRRAQIAIEREGLVHGIDEVQHDVAVQPAEVRIEGLAEGEFGVVITFNFDVGIIVHPHGQHVIDAPKRTFFVISMPHGATPLS